MAKKKAKKKPASKKKRTAARKKPARKKPARRKTQPKAKAKRKTKAKAKPKRKVKAKPKRKVKAKPKRKAKAKPKARTKAKPKTKAKTKTKARASTRSTSRPRPSTKTKAPTSKTPVAKKAAARPSARALGKTVESYVASLPAWQRDAIATIRGVIGTVAPRAIESIKWGQPVFEDNGPFAYIKAFKSHLNFGFWRGVDLPDPLRLLTGDGAKMRHLKITGPSDVVRSALANLVQAAVRLNRQDGDPTRG